MKVVRMVPLQQNGNGKLRAFFDIQTSDGIILKGFRIMSGTNGLFMSPPSEKGKDGKYYDTVILPMDMKDNIQKMALENYNK